MFSLKKSKFDTHLDLYQALFRRESTAYEYLYEQVLGGFKHWVYVNSGSEMDAEDAFQKGLVNFLLNLETGKYQFQENTKITTIVFDYCKKIWLNELESSRVKTRAEMPAQNNFLDTTNLHQDLERMETVSEVRKALHQLKEDCRNVIEWFYIDDFSLKEIAEKLNMKESSTKQKRFDCTQKLKTIFSNLKKGNNL